MRGGIKRDKYDKTVSDLVRERADYNCEHCHKNFRHEPAKMEAAHVHTRAHMNTRYDVRAIFCLCSGCHMRFTRFPLLWAAFCKSKYGDAMYDEIHAAAWRIRKWTKADKDAMRFHYTQEMQRLREMRAIGVVGYIEVVPYE